jgi:hypothetical protein
MYSELVQYTSDVVKFHDVYIFLFDIGSLLSGDQYVLPRYIDDS